MSIPAGGTCDQEERRSGREEAGLREFNGIARRHAGAERTAVDGDGSNEVKTKVAVSGRRSMPRGHRTQRRRRTTAEVVKVDPGGRPLQQKATSSGQDLRRQRGQSGTGERCNPAIGLPSSPPADCNRWLLALPFWFPVLGSVGIASVCPTGLFFQRPGSAQCNLLGLGGAQIAQITSFTSSTYPSLRCPP
ncbi:hypothetical protein BO78DRAFT_225082 [Aspergillus sclerotiicarbonarius CBS 121057]|uniref:Uncharacterized protein n=1 Tax=Aspergillus sclerotiicarbonarius (strain CBS 121057 / IBT 28362) TaxID=1448318 RepID=A0A319DWQ0_ASPSB|nr:hypothetical protein BO78DRAFT_225082 [Aspergillus sclerotiicarbonarius CBS 121057]